MTMSASASDLSVSVSGLGEKQPSYDARSPMPHTPAQSNDPLDPRSQQSTSVSSNFSERSGAPLVRRSSLSSSSIPATLSGRFKLDELKWPAGEPIKPKNFGPIPVQLAVRFLYIKDAETHVQTFDQHGVDKADDDDAREKKAMPAFTCRFSVHQRWPDPYYKLKADDYDLPGYASHPKIGARAENFPNEDVSIHGVKIRTDGCPRWTPEIKFFDTMEPPTQIRCEYSVDRKKGEVTCYYEAKGTFFGTRTFCEGGNAQELVIRLGTQHRTDKLVFVPHPEPHTKGVRADFTIGEFDFEKKPWVVKHKKEDGTLKDGLSAEDTRLISMSKAVTEAVAQGHRSLADAKKLAPPAYGISVYQSMLVLFTIVAGGLFYDEFSQLTTLGLMLGGVILLACFTAPTVDEGFVHLALSVGDGGEVVASLEVVAVPSAAARRARYESLQEKFSGLTEEDFKKFAGFQYISVAKSHAPGYHMACFKLTASVFKRQWWHVRQMKKAGMLTEKVGLIRMVALMLWSWLKALGTLLLGNGPIMAKVGQGAFMGALPVLCRYLDLCEVAFVVSLAKPMGVCKD